MDLTQFSQLRTAASISSSGGVVVSATLFAPVNFARWNLVSGAIQWMDFTNSATMSLYEINDVSSTFAVNSGSSAFFVMCASTTSGSRDFNFAPFAIPASETLTYLVFQVGSVTGHVNLNFVGYSTGGV